MLEKLTPHQFSPLVKKEENMLYASSVKLKSREHRIRPENPFILGTRVLCLDMEIEMFLVTAHTMCIHVLGLILLTWIAVVELLIFK